MYVCGAYWSIRAINLEFYEGNMDSQKYVCILDNNINKITDIHLKMNIALR